MGWVMWGLKEGDGTGEMDSEKKGWKTGCGLEGLEQEGQVCSRLLLWFLRGIYLSVLLLMELEIGGLWSRIASFLIAIRWRQQLSCFARERTREAHCHLYSHHDDIYHVEDIVKTSR